ncbi:MAG: DNA-processing protein DprA [Armatimonadota bacterium]
MKLLKEADNLSNDEISLSDLRYWNFSADSLQQELKLHHKAVDCIINEKDKLLNECKKISNYAHQLGINVITILDSDYPSALKDYYISPPPILYTYGNLSLLHDQKYAVISSSHISPFAVEKTRQISSILAEKGLSVVTSHNTYSYQIAGLAAKSRNAPVILVLDRGILSAFPQGLGWEPVAQARIWNLRFDPSKDLVLSQFRLYDNWIGSNARERDKMVFALADVVVGVEIRSGGMMESECMLAEKKSREVYVYKPDVNIPSGNEYLIGNGLRPIPASWTQSFLDTIDLPAEDEYDDISYDDRIPVN